MVSVKIIRVATEADLADLDIDDTMMVWVLETDSIYIGTPDDLPKKVETSASSNYANHFMLMGL